MSVLKAHYFLWFGSLSGIMPTVPLIAKEYVGANAEDVGKLYCVLPFIVLFMKPLFCSIADRNNSHKKVLITSIVITVLSYGLLITSIFINMGSFDWYWFCLLVLLANSGQGIVISLTDYLVMREVTEINKTFGEYRVFGTLGWGAFGLIAGLINEYIIQLPYLLPGLLMFIVIELLDLFCICYKFKSFQDYNNGSQTNLEMINNTDSQIKRSTILLSIAKALRATSQTIGQIYRIFRNNPSLFQHITVVTIFGCLTAFHWSFYFWFIETIRGHDPLLMGLALFVQSFIGELPIFMISNRILNFCGPTMSLNISLLAFAVRYFVYGYGLRTGTSYWDILLIESVQGLTFSLFYTVMTDLAQHYANKESQSRSLAIQQKSNDTISCSEIQVNQKEGDESSVHNSYATMQGIMGGSFEGFGLGIGSLIGGYVVEKVDVFSLWKYGAIIAVATIVFNILVELIKKLSKKVSK